MNELPRSIRWRLQLGVYELPDGDNYWTIDEFVKRNRTKNWMQRCRYETLEKDYQQELNAAFHLSSGSDEIDPLSVFAMEADAKERRHDRRDEERASAAESTSLTNNNNNSSGGGLHRSSAHRRNTEKFLNDFGLEDDDHDSLASGGNASSGSDDSDNQDIEEVLSTIKKDLRRLQPEHNEVFQKYMFRTYESTEEESSEQRHAQLEEVLYIFAREHPHFSYQQGMHELASLLLLVIEMDVYSNDDDDDDSNKKDSALNGLLDYRYLSHDVYSMVVSLFTKVGPAFSGDSLDVVSKIRFVSGDDKFLRYIVAMDVDPELYCARWIRLLFSREVTHWSVCLPLLDIFMDLTSQHLNVLSLRCPSNYTRPGISPALVPGQIEWLTVLETAAASLIWMQRAELLKFKDPDDGFCYLVNMPKLTCVKGLMSTMLSTMRRLQSGRKPRRTNIEGLNLEDCAKIKKAAADRSRSMSPGPTHARQNRHRSTSRGSSVSRSSGHSVSGSSSIGSGVMSIMRSLSSRHLMPADHQHHPAPSSSGFLSSHHQPSQAPSRSGGRSVTPQPPARPRTLVRAKSPSRGNTSSRSLVSRGASPVRASWSSSSRAARQAITETPTERRRRSEFARQGSAADLYDALTGIVSPVKLPTSVVGAQQ